MIADEARNKLLNIEGVDEAVVDLVWDPPWSREMISEPARLQLGLL
jgi:metal-sulfur cluster biosynthetic enzyme